MWDATLVESIGSAMTCMINTVITNVGKAVRLVVTRLLRMIPRRAQVVRLVFGRLVTWI